MTHHRLGSGCPVCQEESLARSSDEECVKCGHGWVIHEDKRIVGPCQETGCKCKAFVSKCDVPVTP